jgi:pimeloyl-ACP methyl ester carboxylesterase
MSLRHAAVVTVFSIALVAGPYAEAAQIPAAPRPKPYTVPPPPPYEHSVYLSPVEQEWIYVQAPSGKPANRPLLLLFHGAYYDFKWKHNVKPLVNELKAIFDEAASRGWYAVSLTGGQVGDPNVDKVATYANPKVHQRITAVIDEMIALYDINPNKIYTLGYSMGAADAVNYAARHVDPAGHMIAAAWSWSGALSAVLEPTWGCNLFGCPTNPCNPTACHLPWVSASSIVVSDTTCDAGNPSTGYVSNESLAWNLEHVWLRTSMASMGEIPDAVCTVPPIQQLTMNWADPGRYTHIPNLGNAHYDPTAWDPDLICDYFEDKRLTLPTSATKTVAVEDTRYFWFLVDRGNDSQTGSFGWNVSASQLDLTDVNNIGHLWVDVDSGLDSPLDSSGDITIDLTPGATTLIVESIAHTAGVTVWLDGAPATLHTDYDWLTANSLILYARGTSQSVWLINQP